MLDNYFPMADYTWDANVITVDCDRSQCMRALSERV